MINQILNIFQGFRMAPTPLDQYESKGKEILRNKIAGYVSDNKPLRFVMLGFPFKSTNHRDKVLGSDTDLGEDLTIKNFALFNQQIQTSYKPGIVLNMVSDGFVFNDILGVSPAEVEAYKEQSMDLTTTHQAPVQWFDLRDFYRTTLSHGREQLTEHFGITPEKLEHEILFNPDVNFLYRGMIRFMEEELAPQNHPSRNQLQKAAKKLTREMMFRNEAYSNLVKEDFKDCIRLSMHPSVNSGAKYSFQLIPGARHSAWHSSIALYNDGRIETIHRKDAEQKGMKLVYKNNKPYNFTE